MSRNAPFYFAAIVGVASLFFSSLLALVILLSGLLYFVASHRVFRLFWKALFRATSSSAPMTDTEPTLITLVTRAPYQLLGIDRDSGTATIFRSFYERVKGEREEDLRLNKKGRRLAAAKNTMLHARRNRHRLDGPAASAQQRVSHSLRELLEPRPVYAGKVVQYANFSAGIAEAYRKGAEVEDLGLTAYCDEKDCGRGSCRLVIHSHNGRLVHSSGEVAFLPGTRFLVLSREPWQNPNFPGLPAGFSIELAEVAEAV